MANEVIDNIAISESYVDTMVDLTIRANGAVHITGGVVRHLPTSGQSKTAAHVSVSARLVLSFQAAEQLSVGLETMLKQWRDSLKRPN